MREKELRVGRHPPEEGGHENLLCPSAVARFLVGLAIPFPNHPVFHLNRAIYYANEIRFVDVIITPCPRSTLHSTAALVFLFESHGCL